MPSPSSTRLRIAAIDFLNPAPLMWDFQHPPRAAALATRYEIHSTTPALCADELLSGRADLGLIPIASLTPELAIVPGCAIASLDRVRSIQLIVKVKKLGAPRSSPLAVNPKPAVIPSDEPKRSEGAESRDPRILSQQPEIPDASYMPRAPRLDSEAWGQDDTNPPGAPTTWGRTDLDADPTLIDQALRAVRTVAADTASRSSLAYAQLLFRKFLDPPPALQPAFLSAPADPIAMLASADAALLIGDPALLALESRAQIESVAGPCLWLDLAHQWRTRTGLPWVAAVWAVRPEALHHSSLAGASILPSRLSATELIADLTQSRDHGLANLDALVEEWSPRIAVPPATIRHYLTRNIHYTLDADCIAAIMRFRALAAEAALLPALDNLRFLASTA